MRTLEKISIKGFKSIRDQTLELDRLNVFIGANGAGKSNLLGVFKLLREVANKRLQHHVGVEGGADTLLRFGRKMTPRMAFELCFVEKGWSDRYRLEFFGTKDERLTIEVESVRRHDREKREADETEIGESGDNWGASNECWIAGDSEDVSKDLVDDFNGYVVYQFNETGGFSPIGGLCDLEDNRLLRSGGENLAAVLYYLQERHPDRFSVIQETVKQVAPYIDSFQLKPSALNSSKVRLEWREKNQDGYFNASMLSDGTVRFICLATLLLQPELPSLLILDEPELGLHPAAIESLVGMLRSAATKGQVIAATQSVTLMNRLLPEEVWTVERNEDCSVFKQLSSEDFSDWLTEYSLGELWEKNVLGARP